jgi:hypothetical protein
MMQNNTLNPNPLQSPRLLAEYMPMVQSRLLSPLQGGYSATLRETTGLAQVLEALSQKDTAQKNTMPKLHLGWGSYRNLDIAAACQSDYVMICDVSVRQMEMWFSTLAAIRIANNPEEFVKVLATLMKSKTRPRYPIATEPVFEKWLHQDTDRQTSWLHSSEKYKHIQKLVLEERIEILCCDILEENSNNSPHVYDELNRCLSTMKMDGFASPHTVYFSNLAWIMKDNGHFFDPHANPVPEPMHFLPKYRLMLKNLKTIVPHFENVISAHQLADTSSATNIHWQTHLFDGAEFIKGLEDDERPNDYPLHKRSK